MGLRSEEVFAFLVKHTSIRHFPARKFRKFGKFRRIWNSLPDFMKKHINFEDAADVRNIVKNLRRGIVKSLNLKRSLTDNEVQEISDAYRTTRAYYEQCFRVRRVCGVGKPEAQILLRALRKAAFKRRKAAIKRRQELHSLKLEDYLRIGWHSAGWWLLDQLPPCVHNTYSKLAIRICADYVAGE